MYEHLVTDVRHILGSPASNGERPHILNYKRPDHPEGVFSLTFDVSQVGAIETWLAQMKMDTPEDRATRIVARYRQKFGYGFGAHSQDEADVARWIADEIRAAEEIARNNV